MASTISRSHDIHKKLKAHRLVRIRRTQIHNPRIPKFQVTSEVIKYRSSGKVKVIRTCKFGDFKKQAKSKTPELPSDLIFDEILVRLPIKSLARFKSVAKQWRSSIEDPYFVDRQMNQSRPVLVRDCEELTSSGTLRPSPCNSEGFWGHEIITIFEGLVLQRVWDKYSVENPAIRQTLGLPDPLGNSRRMWFDRDPFSGEAKLLCEYKATTEDCVAEKGFQILTIGRDEEWRGLRPPRGEDLLMVLSSEVYFLGLTQTGHGEVYLRVSSFDFRTEHFTVNDFPRGLFPDLSRVVPFWWGQRLAIGDLSEEELRVAVLEKEERNGMYQWGEGLLVIPLSFLREVGVYYVKEKLVPVSGDGSNGCSLWFHYDGVCKFRYDLKSGRVEERVLLASEKREAVQFEYRPSLKSLKGMRPALS